MVKLTDVGKKKVDLYIRNLTAKRKEILDAGKDTADETQIPTVDDVLADIEFVGVDDDGEYYNSWGVTDNYDADEMLVLINGQDFVLDEAVSVMESKEKWRQMTYIEDYEFDPDGKYDGALTKELWDEIFNELYSRAETTEEYLYNDWVEPESTRNAYTEYFIKNGEKYIVLKYYDGPYALYEIKDASEVTEKRAVAASVIEKITSGVSVRQAILESVSGQKTVFEDVAGMDKEDYDAFIAEFEKWIGTGNGYDYTTSTTNNGKTYTVILKKNPIVDLEVDGKQAPISIEANNDILNGEVYCEPADEYLSATGPVTYPGFKSVLRDLLSQWEMVMQELSDSNASEDSGDLYGF